RHRARQYGHRSDQCDRTGYPDGHRAARAALRQPPHVAHRRASIGAEQGAGPHVRRTLLLGPERSDARVVRPVRSTPLGRHADRYPGRGVLNGTPVSEGGGCAEERRRNEGDREDEGIAHRRSPLREGHHPGGWPEDPSHVPLRGQEAIRVQRTLGPLQTACDHPGDRGVPADRPRWLPSGEEVAMAGKHVAAIVVALTVFALVAAGPVPADAQRTRTTYRVAIVNDARAADHPAVNGLKAGLRDLGLDEGRDVVYDIALTDGDPERIAAAARALVRTQANVIFTSGEAATVAAKASTTTIPIVFTLVGDPVAAGIVTSLAHPTGNLTGVSSLATELVVKRLEMLKTLVPGLRRVSAVSHGADPSSSVVVKKAVDGSSRFGLEVVPRTVLTQRELDQVLAGLRAGDAMLVPDVAALELSAVLLETSLARRIPAVFSSELWVSHGGLISYGADYRAQGAQTARLVAKILRGAQPSDIPVEKADRIVLAVNLKTAASFGLSAPRQVLFRADVIRR